MDIGPDDKVMVDGYDVAWMFVIFKEVEGFPEYLVSTKGDIYSCQVAGSRGQRRKPWRKLKPFTDNKGYLRVELYRDGKRSRRMVYRIILTAFRGPRPEGCEACHFPDGTKTNNSLENLRWDTSYANAQDSVILGMKAYGSRNGNAKLTKKDVMSMRALRKEGWSTKELSRKFNIHISYVRDILNFKCWGSRSV